MLLSLPVLKRTLCAAEMCVVVDAPLFCVVEVSVGISSFEKGSQKSTFGIVQQRASKVGPGPESAVVFHVVESLSCGVHLIVVFASRKGRQLAKVVIKPRR